MRVVYRRPVRRATKLTAAIAASSLLAGAAAATEPFPSPRFTIRSFERYFEPDIAEPVRFQIDARGDAGLGPEASRRAVEDALAAWSSITGSPVSLLADGATTDLSRSCPGPNKILFRDPDGLLPPPDPDPEVPGRCRGVLALGITRASSFERKGLDRGTFVRSRCGFVVVADGWEGCSNWTECNLAEAIVHELGHVLGLDHSSMRDDEADPLLRDAAMYYRAHFDGRCASVRDDDEAGVRAIYPDPPPLTITSAPALPAAVAGRFYEVRLDAQPPAASLRWRRGRTNTSGLEVTPDGRIAGVPTSPGDRFLVARVDGTDGSFHEKVFDIAIGPGTPVPTDVPVATPTPTATAVPTATATTLPSPLPPTATATNTPSPTTSPTPAPCPGDCDASGATTVDEILALVNLALGTATASCTAGDVSGDGVVTVDEILLAVDTALSGCSRAPLRARLPSSAAVG